VFGLSYRRITTLCTSWDSFPTQRPMITVPRRMTSDLRRCLASGHRQGVDRRARVGLSARRRRLLYLRGQLLARRGAYPGRKMRSPASKPAARSGHPAAARPILGSEFSARDFRNHLAASSVAHRRGGYRDPEPQSSSSLGSEGQECCAWRAPSGPQVAATSSGMRQPIPECGRRS
jgi:hypothetical protein